MNEPIDLPALRVWLREYDPAVPRCHKPMEVRRNYAPDFVPEQERAEWDVVVTNRCCRPEGHDGDCRSTRLLLGWPGFSALTAMLDEIERLREECHTLRLWAEEAARAENANAEDAKRERAVVVAWLRREMQPCSGTARGTLAYAANGIERGEHRREEKP